MHALKLEASLDSNASSSQTSPAQRFLSFDDDPNLKEGPQVISGLAKDVYKKKWKSSGPYPAASPLWGADSWRGDKQPRQMHGPTRGVGMYKLMQFLKPSQDPKSAAAFPVVPKTATSELKSQGLYPRDSAYVVPKMEAGARKQLVTGPLHGDDYTATRRALFTRDILQKHLTTCKTPENGHKVWPPQLPAEQDVNSSQSPLSSLNALARSQLRPQKTKKFESHLLNEMYQTMGPYLDRTCARTPVPSGTHAARPHGAFVDTSRRCDMIVYIGDMTHVVVYEDRCRCARCLLSVSA